MQSSVNTSSHYDPNAIESERQASWRERGAFDTPDPAAGQPRKYIKPSAPFTSGNIHIGHVRSYSIGDAYARFCRARGDAVLFAFGFDAFGLPAELGAIAGGVSPSEWVDGCATHMIGQLQRLGFSFDWERTFMSSDAVMYRWSQWLFLTLLGNDLIYRGTGTVDWCENCNTTLASIQVENGTCWRCHGPVRLVRRPQWYLRISRYLAENDRAMHTLEHWDETALASQRYVLGRVDGVEMDLTSPDGRVLTLFTPHDDALTDARFVLISPRHADVDLWAADPAIQDELEEMRAGGWERDAREADVVPLVDTKRTVVGYGGVALPVLVSPLVDSRFGVTAVLGIPSQDSTDEVIAGRLGLADAVAPAAGVPDAGAEHTDPRIPESRPAVRYKAYDFSISRQRSWGTPIPIVYCESCGVVPVPDEQLPVVLPLDLKPTGTGNPLAETPEFYSVKCPRCDRAAHRETDTLDCHFDALWLWIPACLPANARERSMEEIFAQPDLRTWLPSERLVAGSDSGNFMFDQRITTKALRDIGPLSFMASGEPFAGALMHEMVIRDGRKMSKHLGNVVDPDELVERYGADTVRLAVLYAARPQRSLNWTDSAVQHCHRFLNQLWEYSQSRFARAAAGGMPPAADELGKDNTEHLRARLGKWCAAAIERTSADMESLEMHSAVRNTMRLFDRIKDYESRVLARRDRLSEEDTDALVAALALLAQMIAPFAPHVGEQLWLASGHGRPGCEPPWPSAPPEVVGAMGARSARPGRHSAADRESSARGPATLNTGQPSQGG
jgi:leucyl-tRNA synthetase